MCRRVNCKKCGKPSWAGCGAHVEMVLGDVPRDERCRCRERGTPAGTRATPGSSATDSALERFRAWLRR